MTFTFFKKSICGLLAAVLCFSVLAACGGKGKNNAGTSASAPVLPTQSTPAPASNSSIAPTIPGGEPNTYEAIALPQEMRGMWISFLEWAKRDISTESKFRAQAETMLDNCASLGMNTVIVSVRAMGDAMYKSEVYPWSHLITGTQGEDPGYDPLAILVEEAHARELRIEAYINPFRVQHGSMGASSFAENHASNTLEHVVKQVGNGLFLDPGQPDSQQLIIDGIAEIVRNYEVDGIHFDDYFYPEKAQDDFDADTYETYGNGQSKADWRRENIDILVRSSYQTVKAANPTVSFGVSPQGNNDNNYNNQYSNIKLWLSTPGYVDYIMPQIYWGFGNDVAPFDEKCAEWAAYPKDDSVRLFAGLGAYRIGMLNADGTRSDFGCSEFGDNSEWESGNAIAAQIEYLQTIEEFSGYALFRYDFLFQEDDDISEKEVSAIQQLIKGLSFK